MSEREANMVEIEGGAVVLRWDPEISFTGQVKGSESLTPGPDQVGHVTQVERLGITRPPVRQEQFRSEGELDG